MPPTPPWATCAWPSPGPWSLFTGPRVMKARGFQVQEDAVRSEGLVKTVGDTYRFDGYYGDIRGIQEVVPRAEMRTALARYP